MKIFIHSTWVRTIITIFAVLVSIIGVLSIITMNHKMVMNGMGTVITQIGNCATSHSTTECVNYHLGIMHNLSSAHMQNADVVLSVLLAAVVFSFFLQNFFLSNRVNYMRTRWKQLREKTIFAFTKQLGFWLIFFQKRDPRGSFA